MQPGSRVRAGLHWFLSGRDDERSRKWLGIVLKESAQAPEDLFRSLYFPELPFDRFSHPAVKERLAKLKADLAARGFDEPKLIALLLKPPSRLGNFFGAAGCVTVILIIVGILLLAVEGWHALTAH